MDFGVLPPEINSGRIYLGPGPAPMLAAATAWHVLAGELSTAAAGYASIITELTGSGWLGPASATMAAAAAPYVAWLDQTAALTAQTAAQATAAAAAFESAFAMTVPPPVIAANRSLLLALVATNFFGQNTTAIAAAEAAYAQMWAQDAAAMYLYAASSAAAGRLTPFTDPPRTADPTGLAAITSSPLVQILEHVPNVTNSVLSSSNAVTSGRGIYIVNMRLASQQALPPQEDLVGGGLLVSAQSGSPTPQRVSARFTRARLVGRLSVPPSWVAAAPEIRPVLPVLPGSTPGVVAAADTGSGGVFSQSVLGTLSRQEPNRSRAKSKPIIVRSPAAG